MVPITMDELEAQRASIMKKVVKLQPTIIALDPTTANFSTLELLTTDLADKCTKVDNLYDKTESLCLSQKMDFKSHEDDFDTLSNAIQVLQVKVMETKRAKDNVTAAARVQATAPSSAKLEALQIPTFNGNYEDWPKFHDLFQAMIHNRIGLSGAEKLTYLQRALIGSASTVISAFEATDANYAEAWAHLKKRYDVKREIIFAHLKAFEDFTPNLTEADSGLRSLVDSISKCIRSLKLQDVPVEHWDLILIYLSLKKIDSESKKQWALGIKTSIPKMTEFLEFLEIRARALVN